jgi:hypothetical protein
MGQGTFNQVFCDPFTRVDKREQNISKTDALHSNHHCSYHALMLHFLQPLNNIVWRDLLALRVRIGVCTWQTQLA